GQRSTLGAGLGRYRVGLAHLWLYGWLERQLDLRRVSTQCRQRQVHTLPMPHCGGHVLLGGLDGHEGSRVGESDVVSRISSRRPYTEDSGDQRRGQSHEHGGAPPACPRPWELCRDGFGLCDASLCVKVVELDANRHRNVQLGLVQVGHIIIVQGFEALDAYQPLERRLQFLSAGKPLFWPLLEAF